MESVLSWVSDYGYIAIYFLLMLGIVGLPIPDETLLVFSGYLVSQGRLNLGLTIFVGFLGSASGITLSYVIGRTLGLGFIHKYGRYIHVTEQRLARVHSWFDRIGHWALFVGYYMPGVRHFTAIVAGTSQLPAVSFATFAFAGAALWVSTFVTLGYYFGANWKVISESAHKYLLVITIVLVVAGCIYLLIRKRAGKAQAKP